MKTQIVETAPDGTVKEYIGDAPVITREDIDIPGSLVAARFMRNGMHHIEAMNKGAAWSEENDALIYDAMAKGLQGLAIVHYVDTENLKRVRAEKPEEILGEECRVAELHEREHRENTVVRTFPQIWPPDQNYPEAMPPQSEQASPVPDPTPQYTIEGAPQSYERAKILAFWLRAQLREAVDDLSERDNRMLAEIIGSDCKLVSAFEFNLNYQEKPTDETEIASPSDPSAAR